VAQSADSPDGDDDLPLDFRLCLRLLHLGVGRLVWCRSVATRRWLASYVCYPTYPISLIAKGGENTEKNSTSDSPTSSMDASFCFDSDTTAR
jgi:hypothetical protein